MIINFLVHFLIFIFVTILSVSTLVGPEYPKVPPLSLPDRGLVRPERADRPDRAERLDRADRGDLQNKLLDALTDDELQQYVKLVITLVFFLKW